MALPLPDPQRVFAPVSHDTNRIAEVITELNALAASVNAALARLNGSPVFVLTRSTSLAIPSNTWTQVAMDSEQIDTHNGHTSGDAWYQVPSGWDGYWLLTGNMYLQYGGTASDMQLRFYKNGNPAGLSSAPIRLVQGTGFTGAATTTLLYLAAGDWVELRVQSIGSSATVYSDNANYSPSINGCWLRP